jgi:ArsR family transcriptional regulator
MNLTARIAPVSALSGLFGALADDTRLRIVALLSHGELCVGHIEAALGLTQTNASRQLAILRAAGVVTSRRQDRWVHYRLAHQDDPERRRHLGALARSFSSQSTLRHDVQRLIHGRGPRASR